MRRWWEELRERKGGGAEEERKGRKCETGGSRDRGMGHEKKGKK